MEKSSHISTAAIPPGDPRLEKFRLFAGWDAEGLPVLLKRSTAIACPDGSRIIPMLGAIGQALVKRLRTSNQKHLDIFLRSGEPSQASP